MNKEKVEPGIDEQEIYGDAPDPTELESDEEKDPEALFPGMKLPKGIKDAAKEMKIAEMARKEHAGIEKDRRDGLTMLMEQHKINRFQIEIDGEDYEFELEEKAKLKSKRVNKEDE